MNSKQKWLWIPLVSLWTFGIAAPKRISVDANALVSQLCEGKEPGCHMVKTTPIADAGNVSLSLWYLVNAATGDPWGVRTPVSPCVAYDVWLVRAIGGQPNSWQHLASVCNDGYGAAGVGMDTFETAKDQLTYCQMGGSAWRWVNCATVDLQTMTIVSQKQSNQWTLDYNRESKVRNWREFDFTSEWYSRDCSDDDAPTSEGEQQVKASVYRFQYIPQVVMPKSFADGGWRAIGLGNCGAKVSSDGSSGFVTHGEVGQKSDAAMTVLGLSQKDLVVEVRDDRIVSGADSWIFDDHIEVWAAEKKLSSGRCLTHDVAAYQWGVRLSDGKVYAAFGNPALLPTVSHWVVSENEVRLRIRMPKIYPAISVAYSDSDDGKKQERLIATSALKHGQARTLGALLPIDGAKAKCQAFGSALVPQVYHEVSPQEPVFSDAL